MRLLWPLPLLWLIWYGVFQIRKRSAEVGRKRMRIVYHTILSNACLTWCQPKGMLQNWEQMKTEKHQMTTNRRKCVKFENLVLVPIPYVLNIYLLKNFIEWVIEGRKEGCLHNILHYSQSRRNWISALQLISQRYLPVIQNLKDMWDVIKFPNICVKGVQKGERMKGAERILKK